MKIVYVYKALALWGGIERIFTDKMNYFSEQYRYDVTIITTCQGNHTVPYSLSPKVKHIDLNIRFHTKYLYSILKQLWIGHKMNIKFKRLLKEQFDTIKPDIIIVTTDLYMDVVTQLANGIPVIAESHSDKYQNLLSNNGKKLNIIQQYEQYKYLKSINKVTELVTLTEQDAKIWNIPKKTVIIPNCIHANHIEHSICENKQVIFVGRFSYQKGIDYAIDIWKIVHQKHPDWELHLYGEGEMKSLYVSEIKNQSLDTTIFIHKPTSHIDNAYKESSIFMLTSRYEPFGLVIPEAMSCGVPCIAFKCAGPMNIIDNQINGILIDNGNIQKFADAICYLIENEQIRKTMGQKAIEKAQFYDIQNIMPKWKELFECILKAKKQE